MTDARKDRSRWLLSVMLGVIFCALSAALLAAVLMLPKNAAARFGEPDSSLSWWNRVVYAAQLLFYEDELTRPVVQAAEEIRFVIDYGETASAVADHLHRQNIIASADSFELYLTWSGLDRTIQAGDYLIEPGLNAIQIAHQLQDATPAEVPFSILAGWRLEEIARSLPTSGLTVMPDEFISFATLPGESNIQLPAGWKKNTSLEGLFLPGLYIIPRDATVDQLTAGLVAEFLTQTGSALEEKFANQGLSLREGIILASIVEKEAMVSDEQPLIASVFLNRLRAGMRLESDPTVQYALGYDAQNETWWKNPLTLDDLAVDSPYNTYLYSGLPPGPICSPSLSAIQAVIAPAQTDYLYFRAACDGSGKHNFSYTYEEHLQNECD